jgi:pimeloyl-ACP methyl ester carboxylesterase
MAEDVHALAEALGLGRFVYVGHSMGGGVGVQLALSHPGALRGLVLVSSVTGMGPLGSAAVCFVGRLMARRRWLLRMMIKSMSVRRPEPGVLEGVVDEAMQVSPATLREYLSPTNRIVGVERLASLTVPTLVLIGSRDTVIPVEQQHRLAATIPGCRKVVFEAEGHVAAAERPDLTFREIERFVAEIRDKG